MTQDVESAAPVGVASPSVRCASSSVGTAKLWRKSWLCRRRHKHDYADVRVMPMLGRKSLQVGLIAV